MNSFKKVGDAWCVLSDTGVTGDVVTVTKRNGQPSTVVLGARVAPMTFAISPPPPRPAAPVADVGGLQRVIAMFDVARRHLRFPAIVLDGFRVSVAGARAAQPGSLTVTGLDAVFNSQRGRSERPWFGRVSLDGLFAPGRNAPDGLAAKLSAFAADPAGEAARYGHLTGRCCFCNRRLGEGADQRSVEVGYGPDCADHFGLAWGTRPARAARAVRDTATAAAIADAPPAAAVAAMLQHDADQLLERDPPQSDRSHAVA
jgi:hypothetical protein